MSRIAELAEAYVEALRLENEPRRYARFLSGLAPPLQEHEITSEMREIIPPLVLDLLKWHNGSKNVNFVSHHSLSSADEIIESFKITSRPRGVLDYAQFVPFTDDHACGSYYYNRQNGLVGDWMFEEDPFDLDMTLEEFLEFCIEKAKSGEWRLTSDGDVHDAEEVSAGSEADEEDENE
ncbi:uncharacterized protein VTP21DRAFT_4295 [Calcarisporiella thermophila]|uniref:uncharacterized protein n=1 Tax=Calcarisporiella thermophila TaxID=911321 RepID=UPI003742E763